jgi:hypothetical protein
VLEWCKLLGDEKNKHFWRNVVTDPPAFEARLLAHLGMTASDFVDLAKMRRYRDKFVAHLDSDVRMEIPLLTAALAADSFYHGHIVRAEAGAGDLFGLADTSDKFARGYEHCFKEAELVYAQAIAGGNEYDDQCPTNASGRPIAERQQSAEPSQARPPASYASLRPIGISTAMISRSEPLAKI